MTRAAEKVRMIPAGGPQLAPNDPKLNVQITAQDWTKVVGWVSEGVPLAEAVDRSGIPRPLFEGLVRTVPERKKELFDAMLVGKRANFDVSKVIDICALLGSGDYDVKQACEAVGAEAPLFLALALADPLCRELYDQARRLQAEAWADKLVKIADDDKGDLDFKGSGNLASVKRSQLMVDTRFKLMSKFHPEKYAAQRKDDATVTVNINYAERLEEARRRVLEGRGMTPEERAAADEAEITLPISDVPVPPRTRVGGTLTGGEMAALAADPLKDIEIDPQIGSPIHKFQRQLKGLHGGPGTQLKFNRDLKQMQRVTKRPYKLKKTRLPDFLKD